MDDELAGRIRAAGLPDVVVQIAILGGGLVHPLLAGRADAVSPQAFAISHRHPELIALWSSGSVGCFAGPDGSLSRWSAELPDEPLTIYPDYLSAVRALLTDIWEDDHDGRHDDARSALAMLLVPPDAVERVLQPLER